MLEAPGARRGQPPERLSGLVPRLAQVGARRPCRSPDLAVSGLRPAPVVLPELRRSLVATGLVWKEQAAPSSTTLANEQGGDVQTGRVLNNYSPVSSVAVSLRIRQTSLACSGSQVIRRGGHRLACVARTTVGALAKSML